MRDEILVFIAFVTLVVVVMGGAALLDHREKNR
jgi:hypothetical protein